MTSRGERHSKLGPTIHGGKWSVDRRRLIGCNLIEMSTWHAANVGIFSQLIITNKNGCSPFYVQRWARTMQWNLTI